MFEEYPKVQPELPQAYQDIYDQHYKDNRQGKTQASKLTMWLEGWLHKKVAADLNGRKDIKTLEIGAGTLNQLDFEHTSPYDIVEPYEALYSDSPNLPKVRNVYRDISDIKGETYDRITNIAVFEHVLDLPAVVARAGMLLNEGGSLRVSIPNEGTILWKLGWVFTSGWEFKRKFGLKYSTLLYYEHCNKAREIEEVLKYFFDDSKCKVLGVSKGLAFYRFYECKKPNLERCREYVKTLPEDYHGNDRYR
jgi:hypothetical protein